MHPLGTFGMKSGSRKCRCISEEELEQPAVVVAAAHGLQLERLVRRPRALRLEPFDRGGVQPRCAPRAGALDSERREARYVHAQPHLAVSIVAVRV